MSKTMEYLELTEDEWEEKFQPIQNPYTTDGSYGNTLFETYGEEYEFVTAQNPNHIWTMVTGDSGDWIITEGWHFVNRIGYFITAVPWEPDTQYDIVSWSDAWRDDCMECGEMFDESKNILNIEGDGFCQTCRVELGIDEEGK